MVKIGIMGGFEQISEILIRLCKLAGLNVINAAKDSCDLAVTDIFIAEIGNASDKSDFNIIILNKGKSELNITLKTDGIFILNSDDKDNFSFIESGVAKIITYGFNSKACVTASSVSQGDYQTIQCCIQRSLPSLSGRLLEEQEFPINAVDKDIYNVLPAVTAALINDINIDLIEKFIF